MFEKGKYLLFWDEQRLDMFRGRILSKQKDYYGHIHSYFVEYVHGTTSVPVECVVKIGSHKDVDTGLFKLFGYFHNRMSKLEEKIDKLERSHQLMIATLKAVRDILQEGKEDGKSKTYSGLCSGGCSGNHKSCHKNGVQKSR